MQTYKRTTSHVKYILLTIGLFSTLYGFGLFIYQIFNWLKTGDWTAYSVLYPLSQMKELEDWVAYPYNWTGVHKILDKIPFTIVLIMFGLLILYLSEEYDYSEYSEEKIEPKSKIL